MEREQVGFCTQDHDHDGIDRQFLTVKDAEDWIEAMELSYKFLRRTCVDGKVVYHCSRDGKYESGAKVPCKKTGHPKNTQSKKNVKCSAHFSVKKDQRGDGYRVTGCIKHQCDQKERYQRIPTTEKMRMVALLNLKIPKKVIIDEHCDILPGRRAITLQDLDSIERQFIKGKQNDLQNITDALRS